MKFKNHFSEKPLIRTFYSSVSNFINICHKFFTYSCVIFTSLFLVILPCFGNQMTCIETQLLADKNETISSIENTYFIEYSKDGEIYENFKITDLDCAFLDVTSFSSDHIKLLCKSYGETEDLVSIESYTSTISISRFTGDLLRIYVNKENNDEIMFRGKCLKSQ